MSNTIYVANAYNPSHGQAIAEVLFDNPGQFNSGHYPESQDIARHPNTPELNAWRDGFGEACVLPGQSAVERDIL